jgi:hypothetical protein
MPGEIVQTRKYPDGLLQVFIGNELKPHHVLVEVATYPEKRALKQALDDLALAYSVLGHLPDLLMLILRSKGTFRITGKHEVSGKLGLSRLTAEWKPVEMWTQPARQFLEKADVSAVPLVTLMDFDGPPEELLQRCAEKIEREAHPKNRANLLAVTQVLTGLRFPDPELLQYAWRRKTHDRIAGVAEDDGEACPQSHPCSFERPLRLCPAECCQAS